jgi:excisionase family DNA binding protein
VTTQDEDFISFEKALNQLKMESTELKRLVSEGEIRAFRDGSSMKFKREDLDNLVPELDMEDDLDFADTLEDDTGMVTEEFSEEDTLLADDDDLLEEEPAAPAATRRSAASRSRARVSEEPEVSTEPVWATAAAILTCVVMIYGFMIAYTISVDGSPGGLTSIFAAN